MKYGHATQIGIRSSCTGRVSELSTLGGETCFLLAIYADSTVLRERYDPLIVICLYIFIQLSICDSISWYSCMTGKKSTARLLLKYLRAEGLVNVRSTRFFQGSTTRWGIAWSYTASAVNLITQADKVK